MYIKNAEKFLHAINFIGDRTGLEPEEQTVEFYKKIDEDKQLLVVKTAPDNIFFISEHINVKPHNKFYEDNMDNFEIYSEYVDIDNFLKVLIKYEVISQDQAKLFYVLNELRRRHEKLVEGDVKDYLKEYMEFCELSIELLNDEMWLTPDGLREFIEICEKDTLI